MTQISFLETCSSISDFGEDVSEKSMWWCCTSLCLAALIISLIISFIVSYLAHRPRLALTMLYSFRLLIVVLLIVKLYKLFSPDHGNVV